MRSSGHCCLETILEMMLPKILLDLRVKESSSRITFVVMVFMWDTGHDCGVVLSWVVIKLEVRVPVLVNNHLVKSRCCLSFIIGSALKHLLCFAQEVLPMRAEINTHNFMLCFFNPLSLTLIINGNRWIIRRLCILHWSILLIADGEVATEHLLLYLFLVLYGRIIGKVLVLHSARGLLETVLASLLVSQLKVALPQIHNWPLNLLTL